MVSTGSSASAWIPQETYGALHLHPLIGNQPELLYSCRLLTLPGQPPAPGLQLEQPEHDSRNQKVIALVASVMCKHAVVRVPSLLRLALSIASVALACLPAFAALGDDVSSVASDQAHLKASVRVLARNSYSIHELLTPKGITIRQYVSPTGTVFGVSWQGFAPDLQQLLGDHFEEYVAAAQRQKPLRGRGVFIDTGDLVVETGGHMRFVVGRAFLRSKLPQGINGDDLR
jgi:hypothetical protein